MLVHVCGRSTREAERRKMESSRPAWATQATLFKREEKKEGEIRRSVGGHGVH